MECNKHTAAAIAFVLFAAAIFRYPLPLSLARLALLGTFKVGVLIVFAVLLFKINKWVGAFLILAVISRTIPVKTVESIQALNMVLYGLGWYFFVYHFADAEQLMDVICVIAGVNFGVIIVQLLDLTPIFVGNLLGLMHNPNEISALFALCFPAFLRDGRKKFLFIPVIGVLFTGSFVGILGIGAAAIFYGYMSGVGPWLIYAPIAVAVFAVFIKMPTFGERLEVWKNVLWMDGVVILKDKAVFPFKKAWLLGCGLGNFKAVGLVLAKAGIRLYEGNENPWIRVHNTFLQGLVEMGIMYAVIMTGYIVSLIRKYTKAALIPMTALVAIIIVGSANSVLRMNAVNALVIITWLAILENQLRENGRRSSRIT